MVTTRPPKTIVKPTALGPVANTDPKLLIYGLFQKGRVLAQDGVEADYIDEVKLPAAQSVRRQLNLTVSPEQVRTHRGDGIAQPLVVGLANSEGFHHAQA